jgi:parallel beta-helix repeat protein
LSGARFILTALCCLLLAACDWSSISSELMAPAAQQAAQQEDGGTPADDEPATDEPATDEPADDGAAVDAPAPPDMAGVSFDGPITISDGGTYTGNWQSNDPDVAAVTVDTTEPVTIAGSNIRSRGDLIVSGVEGTDVTVANNAAQGLNPQRDGVEVGRFVSLHRARRAVIEHNDVSATAGIEFVQYGGNGSDKQTFKVRHNRVRNVDGRVSTGNGMSDNDDAAELRQFVQFNEITDVPGMEVAWNEVHNEPGESRVEDNISVWISSGTPDSPIDIHHNFIDGAYPTNPESDPFSGGGIMAGDGSSGGAPANVTVRENTVLNTANYGIAISSGRNMKLIDNQVLSTGRLPGGGTVASQNVGAYVWNMLGQEFTDTTASGNIVGWEKPGGRNDFWMPDVHQASANSSFDGDVTDAVLEQAYADWRKAARTAGVEVGISD